ncbi:MAG: hypothetical protein R2753_17180 [Chitinophagales bacterium]
MRSCDPSEVGTTIDTLIAANGCDSIITTNTLISTYDIPNETTVILASDRLIHYDALV